MPTDLLNLFTSSLNAPENQGWEITSPRPAIAPVALRIPHSGRHNNAALGLSGDNKISAFGSWSRTIQQLKPNATYRFTAFARCEKNADLQSSLFVNLEWLDAAGNKLRSPDFVFIPNPTTEWTALELTTLTPPETAAVTINLGLRWAPTTTAFFDDVSLTLLESPKQRTIKVAAAAINLKRGDTRSSADSVSRFVNLVDQSLPKNTDILCLPEGISVVGTGKTVAEVAESFANSPSIQTLAALAKRHQTYIVAGLYELAGNIIYNTAVLIDRAGKLAGTYRKTHLPQEETTAGITPGSQYPVFQTDFGKIGILICWDIQFPEPARALALQGAELILLPIWGGDEILTRARAIENHLFLVSASYHMKTVIIDPTGKSLAEAPHPDQGLISADINLDAQIFHSWLGDMKSRTWMERRADLAHFAR